MIYDTVSIHQYAFAYSVVPMSPVAVVVGGYPHRGRDVRPLSTPFQSEGTPSALAAVAASMLKEVSTPYQL